MWARWEYLLFYAISHMYKYIYVPSLIRHISGLAPWLEIATPKVLVVCSTLVRAILPLFFFFFQQLRVAYEKKTVNMRWYYLLRKPSEYK